MCVWKRSVRGNTIICDKYERVCLCVCESDRKRGVVYQLAIERMNVRAISQVTQPVKLTLPFTLRSVCFIFWASYEVAFLLPGSTGAV